MKKNNLEVDYERNRFYLRTIVVNCFQEFARRWIFTDNLREGDFFGRLATEEHKRREAQASKRVARVERKTPLTRRFTALRRI